MIVAVKKNVATVLSLAHHYFSRVVFRTQLLAGRDPLSIQVETTQTASVVSNHDSVWV